ncbi:hypothetical protein RB195_014627 [Necator americanus]|uniref:G-protein coupled receptors family 1 profile domain-containing protein n=1 Tax=Necator americanus TaxID=51031 RepID=A0ABR1E283_NECAM
MQSTPFKKYFAYRLLSVLGLCDCILLMSRFITATSATTQYTLPLIPNKVLGSINFSTMATLFYVTVVIYINRLIIIVFHRFSQHLFSKSNEKLILASILLSFLTILVLFLLPEVDNFYDSRYLMWLAPSNQETVKVLITYKDTLMFFAVLTGNICYITIIAFLLLTAKDRRAGFDKVVTLQASFILVYNTSSYAYWSFIHVRLFHCDLNARFISALFWALANGINPFLYLVVNRQLRERVISFLQKRRTETRTVAVISLKRAKHQNT